MRDRCGPRFGELGESALVESPPSGSLLFAVVFVGHFGNRGESYAPQAQPPGAEGDPATSSAAAPTADSAVYGLGSCKTLGTKRGHYVAAVGQLPDIFAGDTIEIDLVEG